jgi:hypothetical protein
MLKAEKTFLTFELPHLGHFFCDLSAVTPSNISKG